MMGPPNAEEIGDLVQEALANAMLHSNNFSSGHVTKGDLRPQDS
jgi:hypothetical protein